MARLGETADVRAIGADDGNLGAGEEGLQDQTQPCNQE
jgi:hypothetical protein